MIIILCLAILLDRQAWASEATVEEVHREIMYVYYSQIGIFDVQDWDSIPYDSGIRDASGLRSPKWLIVIAPSDSELEVVVMKGYGRPEGRQIMAGEVLVGSEGLQVGSPPLEFAHIAWPSGRTQVSVYVQGSEVQPSRITFVLMQSDA